MGSHAGECNWEREQNVNRKMKQPFSTISRLSYLRRAGDTQDYVDDLETGESLAYGSPDIHEMECSAAIDFELTPRGNLS